MSKTIPFVEIILNRMNYAGKDARCQAEEFYRRSEFQPKDLTLEMNILTGPDQPQVPVLSLEWKRIMGRNLLNGSATVGVGVMLAAASGVGVKLATEVFVMVIFAPSRTNR